MGNLFEMIPDRRKRSIKKFLYSRPSYLEICDYCDKGTLQEIPIPAAIQSETPLSYSEIDREIETCSKNDVL